MPSYDAIVENASEKLLEDEKLRSYLTDSESKVLMDWALDWIEQRVDTARDQASAKKIAAREVARVRQAMSQLNAMAKGSRLPKMEDALTALGVKPRDPVPQTQSMTREQVFARLTKMLSASWRERAKPAASRGPRRSI